MHRGYRSREVRSYRWHRSAHGKSIAGQFHRPGKILLSLSLPRGNLSSTPPSISPFIGRRSAYSHSFNGLFAGVRTRDLAGKNANKRRKRNERGTGRTRVSLGAIKIRERKIEFKVAISVEVRTFDCTVPRVQISDLFVSVFFGTIKPSNHQSTAPSSIQNPGKIVQ